ncbi:hypothetical protein B9Z65_3838 [Elsinoe australis]|uniref:PAN2-PAN3 deadenylation complex catalytic subunit PAN2 n=1 Tax=Elsinoe australis TaxID=40998 RepID=A0A2P8A2Q9_9PEZI|nr:hypothetical protein B9Z65_3838 [Elsinoe australis]
MEADWDEVARIPLPPPGPNALHTPVNALIFDNSQELLWTGNEYGRVTSFYGNELQKYTSYRAHPSPEGAVKQFLVCDKGIISISAKSVHLASRRGLTQWHINEPDMTDLRCMTFTTKGTSEILVAGCQSQMFRIDVEKGVVAETLPCEGAYTLMKRGGQHICAAAADGHIHILEANAFKIVRTWKAHSGWINDMDVRSEILVTCGWSPRQQHGFMLDHLANVFDLKNLSPLPPVPFPPGAAFVRMHPRMSTTCIVASQTGLMYAVDIMNPDVPSMKHANIFDTHLLALDLAPSGEALALTDAQCAIHLWGSPTKIQFTEYSNPTGFADPAQPTPPLDWSPEIPLNLIGMPYYRDTLLSSWPSHFVHEVGAPPTKIDPKILASLKRAEMGGYAPWPRKTRRYQVEDTRAIQRAQDTLAAPKFLSEKARDAKEENTRHNGERRISDALEFLAGMNMEDNSRRDVPVIYKNVEIKYSKFGVDDFDFEYFNKTKHSGLETHIANSYANSLLQLLRFIPVVRNLVLHHTATACLYDNCLLCEMGFLTDMLEKAAGMNCQASNFLKVYSSLPDAATLGLLEEHTHNNPLTAMIQAANRYFLRSFSDSFKRLPPHPLLMEQALTTGAVVAVRCAHCGNELLKPGATQVHDLVYPPKAKHHQRQPPRNFSFILKSSVERQESSRGWCDRCKRYQQLTTKKTIQALPKVLMINVAIHSLDQRQLWSSPNWLPQEIGIIIQNGQFFCYEGTDLQLHLQRGVYNITVYELVGLVADIHSGDNQSSHLVSLINVSSSSRDPEDNNSWHLFNDFLVRPISAEDALRFDATWKLPSVLAYQVKSASKVMDDSWKDSLDPTLLYHLPRGPHKNPSPDVLRPLTPGVETPATGIPMAIDAEFVALSKAEIDLRADGTRETIRPPRLGLARVSVCRGAGTDTGLPFIDDYIAINEPVVDYLTAYSGISPGDLDRSVSKHNLVSLKAAYKKLWILLNLGVVFVGHGLAKDFRTINIHVPKAQVIDTIDLFSLGVRSQRKLSLRFLAWYLLREEVQEGEHGHDSVEDARTALKLWEKWKVLEAEGLVEQAIDDIWIGGRDVGYKAPGQWKAEQKREELERAGTPSGGGAGSAPGTPARRVVSAAMAGRGVGSPLR